MTIATATILITLWNSILSWDRGMAFEKRSAVEYIAENQRNATSEWIKNMTVSVGLLGIRISSTDLAVIGSASLLIIMVWFFFSQRRENRAIVSLLRYCFEGLKNKELSKDVCELVYEGTVQSIVFIDMGGGDKPIEGLVPTDEKAQSTFFIRTILKGLIFLPPFTIFMIVVSDIASLFFASYLRDSQKMLYEILFDGTHTIPVTKIVIYDLFALLTCVYTWFLCKKCRNFSKATADTIKVYKTEIDAHGF
ncbi:MAG TPA: hypothetical protein VGC76_07920 [Pyrinomonadaceae bacterium]